MICLFRAAENSFFGQNAGDCLLVKPNANSLRRRDERAVIG
jgi:hypothetical protein